MTISMLPVILRTIAYPHQSRGRHVMSVLVSGAYGVRDALLGE